MQAKGSILDRFNVALITGGGGGLGKAIAQNLIKNGKKVIIAGRTEANLKKSQEDLGSSCVAYYIVDLTNIGFLHEFTVKVIKEHPDVDCVINNAGVHKILDYTKEVNPKDVDEEISTNILALITLCSEFSKHLQSKPSSALMNVASGLAYVPMHSTPVYSATKAFVKSFTQSLRLQFAKTSVTVVEISPPLVESNLYREYENPDAVNKSAMTQDEFMRQVEEGWKQGSQEVGAGMGVEMQEKWRETFEESWKQLNGQTH